MILLQILSRSLTLLCSSPILKVLMVLECWCVVSGQVEVRLKSIAPVGIEVLCLLNLVGPSWVDPFSALCLLSPSSTVPTSSAVCILLSVFPSFLINASNFA